jgi:hypothetical protein
MKKLIFTGLMGLMGLMVALGQNGTVTKGLTLSANGTVVSPLDFWPHNASAIRAGIGLAATDDATFGTISADEIGAENLYGSHLYIGTVHFGGDYLYSDSGLYYNNGGGDRRVLLTGESDIPMANGSHLQVGTFDNGLGGSNGISMMCSAGIELNWQVGHLRATADGGTTTSPIIFDSPVVFLTHDLGGTGEGITPDYSLGSYQKVYLTTDTTFNAPSNGTVGAVMYIEISYATGTYSLNFDSSIRRTPAVDAVLPVTLEAYKSYLITLRFIGGVWCFIDIKGPFPEIVD